MKNDCEESSPKDECEADEENKEKHRMWIDYPEDQNCCFIFGLLPGSFGMGFI